MTSVTFWTLFMETGDPVYYLLYREALGEELTRASEEKSA